MSTQDRSSSAGWRRPPSLVAELTTYMPAAEALRRSSADDSRRAPCARDSALERVVGVLSNKRELREA